VDQDTTGLPGDQQASTPAPSQRPARRRGRPPRARGKPNSSDDAAGRWTIRGVPPPVREMALRRATERGMTVGDWVAEAIIGFARAAARPAGDRGNLPATDSPPDLVGLIQRLDDRISRLEQRRSIGILGRLFGRRP
jgi:hypothetical protein